MNDLSALFKTYIDLTLAVLIVISAYWGRKYICNIFPKISMAHKVLIWSTIITVLYYFIAQKTGIKSTDGIVKYLITYFFATSFYELVFSPLEKWVTAGLDWIGRAVSNGKKDSDTPVIQMSKPPEDESHLPH